MQHLPDRCTGSDYIVSLHPQKLLMRANMTGSLRYEFWKGWGKEPIRANRLRGEDMGWRNYGVESTEPTWSS